MHFCGTKVLHCLLRICVLAQNGLLLDDLALDNFGLLEGRVEVFDFGKKPLRTSLEKKAVTNSMWKFWSQAAKIRGRLPLSREEQQYYQDVHDWFRFTLWADTRVSLLDCIEELRKKVAKNPLMNVAPGACSFGVDSSGAHPTS